MEKGYRSVVHNCRRVTLFQPFSIIPSAYNSVKNPMEVNKSGLGDDLLQAIEGLKAWCGPRRFRRSAPGSLGSECQGAKVRQCTRRGIPVRRGPLPTARRSPMHRRYPIQIWWLRALAGFGVLAVLLPHLTGNCHH
jgi:hypothetical protein